MKFDKLNNLVSYKEAERLGQRNQKWIIHLVSTSADSNKFWRAEGSSLTKPVKISWGRIGSRGQSTFKDWTYTKKKVQDKLKKGYYYVGKNPAEESLTDETKRILYKGASNLLAYLTPYLKTLKGRVDGLVKELELFGELRRADVSLAIKELEEAFIKTNKQAAIVESGLKKSLPKTNKQAFFWGKPASKPKIDPIASEISAIGAEIRDLAPYVTGSFYPGDGLPNYEDNDNLVLNYYDNGGKSSKNIQPWQDLYNMCSLYHDTLGAQGVDEFDSVADNLKNTIKLFSKIEKKSKKGYSYYVYEIGNSLDKYNQNSLTEKIAKLWLTKKSS